MEFDVPTLDF